MIISAITKVKDALLTIEVDGSPFTNIGHFVAPDAVNPPYIVWMEVTESDQLRTDNYKAGQTIEGSIDLFTKDEFDELFDKIQAALVAAQIDFRLESVNYEDETELIHYEWSWYVAYC